MKLNENIMIIINKIDICIKIIPMNGYVKLGAKKVIAIYYPVVSDF